MSVNTDQLVVKAQLIEELAYHDTERAKKEIGPLWNFMEDCLVPGADICVHIREVKQVPPDFKSHVEPHKHDVSSVYSIIGDLTMEIMLEDKKYEVTGPASVFIPVGVTHAVRPLKGKGYLIVIVRSGDYV
jgi:mannose-6-phosphate isomerase-like protein (cupin superfamily)